MKLSPTILFAAFVLLLATPAWGQDTPELKPATKPIAKTQPTLEQITAEPDWIARSPQNPRWTVLQSAVIFSARRPGLVGRDFSDEYAIFTSNIKRDSIDPSLPIYIPEPVKANPHSNAPNFTAQGNWNADRTLRLLNHSGDIFLYNAEAQSTTQLTKTTTRESQAMFLASTRPVFIRYAFRRDGLWFIRNLDSGWEFQAADIRYEDEPKDPTEAREKEIENRTDLQRQQRELFDIINLEDQRKAMRQDDQFAKIDTDPTAVAGPFYMGKDTRSQGTWLSPNARFMIVATSPKEQPDNKRDIMPNYINEDGYVSTRAVRTKVGLRSQTPVTFHLLNLAKEDLPHDQRILRMPLETITTQKEIDDANFKVVTDFIEARNNQDQDSTTEKETADDNQDQGTMPDSKPEPEPILVSSLGVRWSPSGDHAAFMLRSHDNKDRWIVMVSTNQSNHQPLIVHHLHDPAWINWDFNEFGFIPNTHTLWFLSEETGFSHLYTYNPESKQTIQHTSGNFEVRDVTIAHDPTNQTRYAYFRTNQSHPGIQELYRLNLKSNKLKPITDLKGTIENYEISPDQTQAVITYSNINTPPELYLIDLNPNPLLQEPPIQLTHTITDAFKNTDLKTPQIIPVPSTHTDQPIYARLYLPDATKFKGPRPLVLFSHGAGYLQHANYQWSYYKREHMYHTILTNLGFIVIAPDFRASAGYGRDWRTAIYRKMGYKELEDFKDCIDYVVNNHNADPENVGIYGGSYGGFMTLMAMFLEPETYKAGAALRSVTDWRHYNHGYTSNILNTPDIDPEAYEKSSPINHAEGLQGHLLMLHGMQDNNVVAQDIIRLSQRLIELEKQNWELALHPIEPHGYQEPSSWLDQMRRIHKLFMSELAGKQ